MLGALCAMLARSAHSRRRATPVGTWQTIDDQHRQAESDHPDRRRRQRRSCRAKSCAALGEFDHPERRCTACTDERKDQLVKGMTIITGMRQNGEHWDGGQILDPENGKLYKCKMHLEDGGQKLVVRGYIGVSLLGRSQTWVRQQ